MYGHASASPHVVLCIYIQTFTLEMAAPIRCMGYHIFQTFQAICRSGVGSSNDKIGIAHKVDLFA